MRRALSDIARRIRLLVNRGVLTGSNDAGKVQRLQVSLLPGEVADSVQHMQPFGLSARAPDGAEAVIAGIGGARSHLVVLVVSDARYRVANLEKGETAIYNQWGDVVYLKEDGTIEVVARNAVQVTAPEVTVTASSKVALDAPSVECTGNLSAAGNISDANGSMQEMRGTFNSHKHTGVTPGGGLSGTPDAQME